MIAPIVHLAAIDLGQANDALTAWGHAMGPCHRPDGLAWAHGLFASGELVAVTVTATLIRPTCAGLTRAQAGELARLCSARPDLCRAALRLWREFVFPIAAARYGWTWAVSYQDERLHTGNTYRFDGWVKLARSRSGTDSRSGKRGRVKTIWGWTADPIARRSVVMIPADRPKLKAGSCPAPELCQ